MIGDPHSAGWTLDPALERDTITVGDLPLCRVLLINDANYPWLLLVPRRHHIVEITDLDTIEQAQLMTEMAHATRTLKAITGCDKINIATIGIVVLQMHVHIIARSRGDPAWPKPVWNAVPARPYDEATLNKLMKPLRARMTLTPV